MEFTAQNAKRLLCIDVFRGLTIFFMIMVNNAGDGRYVYWPLEHASWNGLTPTDLVFPFFLFIAGASIYFALSRRKAEGTQINALYWTILRRGLTIILIGIVLHSIPDYNDSKIFTWERFFTYMRFPGVLQRIGLVYIIVSTLFLKLDMKALKYIAFSCLLGYYLLMRFVPVPGVGPANFEPALNLESWLDRVVLGTNHLYQNTFFWDPEGLLSTLPAIGTGILGLLTGQVLKADWDNKNKLQYMLKNGAIYLVLGILAWIFLMPSNKNLWSSTFVLITAGLANILLSGFFYLIDIRKSTSWTGPFVFYGMNSILVYILAEFMEVFLSFIRLPGENGRSTGLFHWIFQYVFYPVFPSPYFASMVWSFTYALLFLPLVWFFYKRRFFLKV